MGRRLTRSGPSGEQGSFSLFRSRNCLGLGRGHEMPASDVMGLALLEFAFEMDSQPRGPNVGRVTGPPCADFRPAGSDEKRSGGLGENPAAKPQGPRDTALQAAR